MPQTKGAGIAGNSMPGSGIIGSGIIERGIKMRITEKDLQATCDRINRMLDKPLEPNIGCYHLDHAYGGVALHQMVNDGGGVRDILGGHLTKRDLYERMNAFIKGLEEVKK